MHVVVLGAGVVGITTAYYLAEHGCRVTVIEKAAVVANGASYANGGQLSYSFVESFAQPSFIAGIPRALTGGDPGSKIRLSTALLRWGFRYLGNCTPGRVRTSTRTLLDLAVRSAQLLPDIQTQTAVEFGLRPAGKLVLLASNKEVKAAEQTTRVKQDHGVDVRLLSAAEALSVEPALSSFKTPVKAAVYSKRDEVADAQSFANGLQRYLEKTRDVEFRFNSTVKRLIRENERITGVECDTAIKADAVVVCLGASSGALLQGVGINPRIYPVRGYSVTLATTDEAPKVSVTVPGDRIVFSRLNGSVRIAGFADFADFDTSNDDERIKTLMKTAENAAPAAANYAAEQPYPWGGFRPMTPSGVPLTGPTRIAGLHLNTGHGMFGWTLACATAERTAHAIIDSH